MSMKEWAEKEVELACKWDMVNHTTEDYTTEDYTKEDHAYFSAIYESALKAFNSLLEDGRSGMSIGFTKAILNRLIDGVPLTPIEDTDDMWGECVMDTEMFKAYQCKRMDALFKQIYKDGHIEYYNVDRVVGIDVDDSACGYHDAFLSNICDELFGPITMPYSPEDAPYCFYTERFAVEPQYGDYDTIGILYVIKPDGERVELNRFFKRGEDGFVEIDQSEYSEIITGNMKGEKR